jgi:hypothetical protein
MKKIFFTLIVLVGFATVGFSQDRGTIANTEGKEQLMSSKVSGEYTFTLPSNVTNEMVTKNASYYPSYFTVNFDNASKTANISMVNNEAKSRYVIARFLSACGVKEVEIDGKNVPVHVFIEEYLK